MDKKQKEFSPIKEVTTPKSQSLEAKEHINLTARLNLLEQLTSGNIKFSGSEFMVQDDIFIYNMQPYDFPKYIPKSENSIKYITKGGSSYIFKFSASPISQTGSPEEVNFVIKIVPYSLNPINPYAKLAYDDPARPENVDVEMLKLLSRLVRVGYTPHINLAALAFRCYKYNHYINYLLKLFIGTAEYQSLSTVGKLNRYSEYAAYVEDRPITKIAGIAGEHYINRLITDLNAGKPIESTVDQANELYTGSSSSSSSNSSTSNSSTSSSSISSASISSASISSSSTSSSSISSASISSSSTSSSSTSSSSTSSSSTSSSSTSSSSTSSSSTSSSSTSSSSTSSSSTSSSSTSSSSTSSSSTSSSSTSSSSTSSSSTSSSSTSSSSTSSSSSSSGSSTNRFSTWLTSLINRSSNNQMIEPSISPIIEPNISQMIELSVSPIIEPNISPIMEPSITQMLQPSTSQVSDEKFINFTNDLIKFKKLLKDTSSAIEDIFDGNKLLRLVSEPKLLLDKIKYVEHLVQAHIKNITLRSKISYVPIAGMGSQEINIQEMNLVYFAEWAKYSNFFETLERRPSPEYIRLMLFQIIYTLAVIQNELPSWRHNDFFSQNILLQENTGEKIYYQFKGRNFLTPSCDASIRFWDFDFANSNEVINDKVHNGIFNKIGINPSPCPQYDLVTLFMGISQYHKIVKEPGYEECANFLSILNKLETYGLYLEKEDLSDRKRELKASKHETGDVFYRAIRDNRLTSLAQKYLDKFEISYINKEGKIMETTLDKITAEFLLLESGYFNRFRVASVAGMQTIERYHYP